MMADRPILFSAPMVRALLDGTKTQTRRVLNRAKTIAQGPECPSRPLYGEGMTAALAEARDFRCVDGDVWSWFAKPAPWQGIDDHLQVLAKLPYAVGDRLWVREALEQANGEAVGYPADGSWLPNTSWVWKRKKLPSIHMPRGLSRLTLAVTDVRVERLQDINEADAQAEGRGPCPLCHDCGWVNSGPDGGYQCPDDTCGDSDREWFARLWNGINGPGAWEANPWVVAVSFGVEQRNIDAGKAA